MNELNYVRIQYMLLERFKLTAKRISCKIQSVFFRTLRVDHLRLNSHREYVPLQNDTSTDRYNLFILTQSLYFAWRIALAERDFLVI